MEEHRHKTDRRTIERRVDEAGKICFIRLNLSERVQHMIFLVSFFVLMVTGFMVKTPEEVVIVLGGAGESVFFVRKILHRVAGVAMIMVSVYHLFYILFREPGRRWIRDMMLRFGDFRDLYNNMLYFIGRREAPPEFDRFCYKHKMEYFSLFVGTFLMSVTGAMLWTEYKWDKFFLDVAVIVHGMEAILACLAIIVWHLFEVHLRPHKFPIDNLWITGVIDKDEMKEEYPLHYKKIMDDPRLRDIYIKKKES